MNSLEHFNQFYSTHGTMPFPKSLLEFYKSTVKQRVQGERILELGCGPRSMFEDLDVKKNSVTAVDFSSVAIEQALSLYSDITYKTLDLTFPDALLEKSYDLIFDSHCLHCIDNPAGRVSAFKNIHEALTDNGIFAAEMMVQPAHKSVAFPMKYIPQARALEEEILGHGFKIIYFMIGKGLSFENGNEECDLLRVIAKKAED